MFVEPYSDCIKCYFSDNSGNNKKHSSAYVDIFFAETGSLGPLLPVLKKYVAGDEMIRAGNFHSDTDRSTYLVCHALLRLILAERLNVSPSELSFTKGNDDKPELSENQVYFNISHTREAFAIAIVKDFHVGIDLERVNKRINTTSVIEQYFSKKEQEYIRIQGNDGINSFFLLWTRKEALLKAIGTGMINDLNQINVSEQENFINKELFRKKGYDSVSNEYYLYSYRLNDHFLSIAVPNPCSINLTVINENFFNSFAE